MEDENIFVFSYYGPNTVFWFFRLNEGDDPPVYAYGDDADGLEKMNDRLSDYIESQISAKTICGKQAFFDLLRQGEKVV